MANTSRLVFPPYLVVVITALLFRDFQRLMSDLCIPVLLTSSPALVQSTLFGLRDWNVSAQANFKVLFVDVLRG